MTPRTLLDIRYYDQSFHPDFFREKGWRGRFILLLNWFRFWLETYIQYRVMKLGFSHQEIPANNQKEVVRQFWRDVREERKTSSLLSPFSRKEEGDASSSSLSPREVRYTRGRKTFEVSDLGGEEQQVRPVPLDGLFERMSQPARVRRYAVGPTIHEEVEPVVVQTEKE